jgi:hypothetical protein
MAMEIFQMATFDQRAQKVTYQYNAAGNINFGAVTTNTDIVVELNKLLDEVTKAIKIGAIDPENGVDVESKLKNAIIKIKKSKPDKKSVLDNIEGAKKIIESMASATGLVGGFIQAAEAIRRFL